MIFNWFDFKALSLGKKINITKGNKGFRGSKINCYFKELLNDTKSNVQEEKREIR